MHTHTHTHTHTYTFFFIFFSIMIYHGILNIVPYAIQQGLVMYLFCIQQFGSANLKLLIYPSSTSPSPLRNTSLFSLPVCFIDKFFCVIFQIPHISDVIWYLSFSLRLTSLSMIISQSIHVAANGTISFIFMAEYACSSEFQQSYLKS